MPEWGRCWCRCRWPPELVKWSQVWPPLPSCPRDNVTKMIKTGAFGAKTFADISKSLWVVLSVLSACAAGSFKLSKTLSSHNSKKLNFIAKYIHHFTNILLNLFKFKTMARLMKAWPFFILFAFSNIPICTNLEKVSNSSWKLCQRAKMPELRISLCYVGVDLEAWRTQGTKGCQRGTHVGSSRKEKFGCKISSLIWAKLK